MKINIAHEILDEVIIIKHQFANSIAKIIWVAIDVWQSNGLEVTYKVRLTDVSENNSYRLTPIQIKEIKKESVYLKDDDFLNITNTKYDRNHHKSTVDKREKYVTKQNSNTQELC